MKQTMINKVVAASVSAALVFSPLISDACTAVNIVAKDGSVVAGRTMEWAFDMKWQLTANPKGMPISLSAPASLKLPITSLSSKYAFVAIAPGVLAGPPAYLEGQNEAGLGISGNFLPGFTQYQTVTPQDKNYVSILNLGGFILGMFGSVKELRSELPKYKVWFDPSEVKGLPTPPWLHLVLTDRSGDSIVVEFVKGQMMIHNNVAGVLTNAPTYDWHLNNVRNYLSLTSTATSSVTVDNINVTELGQGGGLMGLPADYTPPSRFVRATYLKHFTYQPSNSVEAMQAADHVLNNVDIPVGVARSSDGKQVFSDYTQWVNIKDLKNNRMKIANYANRTNFVEIDLNQVFKSGKSKTWLIDKLPYPQNDLTAELLKSE
ncbi:choloylglycine hydrolase family protein [Polynucleobacter sp. AP-Latsch-80-C2]|uniref:choloylglycine hydrolase family protein n=1 Tax=Polynucleobacter sp. AP-Latsch-80-C2 TaxID=2576931 RepID=UPI001C0C30E4|nr:choloylglycine hydrolase family protein [Polynucleobacter sp. AP-Latsch-80-C2]